MAKKKRNKTMKKTKTKKSHKDLYHLTMVLKYTERNIKNDGSDMDELFKTQAEKVKKQIGELG